VRCPGPRARAWQGCPLGPLAGSTPFWKMSRLLVALALMGCALPAWGFVNFVSSGLRTANIMISRNGFSAVALRQRNTLPFTGRPMSQKALHLRMSDESTTVKEQCDGPAKEGEIGNVDVSAAKFGIEDVPTDGVIQLSENAKKQLTQLRKARGDAELVLRVGVRSGGCRFFYFKFIFKSMDFAAPAHQ
jgi:hypothetical protein